MDGTRRGRPVTVVFDGYDSTNMKDITHQRGPRGNSGTTVTSIYIWHPVTMQKDQCRANRQTKQGFIFMQSE